MSPIRPAAAVGLCWGGRLAERTHLLPPWRRLRLHGGPRGSRRPGVREHVVSAAATPLRGKQVRQDEISGGAV